MKIPFSPPDIGEAEIQAVVDCLKSGWITTGPKTKEFEERISRFCNTEKSACLNSATAALELSLRALGIGEGDEVITCAYTYTASASVVCHVNAKLVLVDVKKDSFFIDYDALENAITENTKAIIPVDFAGVMCDYDRIFEIVEKKKHLFKPKNDIQKKIGRVAVIADSAHAFGSLRNNRICGSVADFTCFSFHAVKNLTTAEGGAVTWKNIDGIDNNELYTMFMNYSLHGQTKDALSKTRAGSWEYDIINPYYKCNMTDIMASMGIAQLNRYDETLKRRRDLVKKYNEYFKDLNIQTLPHIEKPNVSNCHLYVTRLIGKSIEYRNRIIELMAKKGIAANVHFKPLPMLTAYKNLGFDIKDYPNAYEMYKGEITLPLNTCITDEESDYVIKVFKELLLNEK